MKYVDVSSFEFAQAIQKIAQTPIDNFTACKIRRVTKALTKVREQISKHYQDSIVEKYAKRDDAGKIIRPKDQPNGFDLDQEKAGFVEEQEAFGKTEVSLECSPFTPIMLKDIKLSAYELEKLGPLFDDSVSE